MFYLYSRICNHLYSSIHQIVAFVLCGSAFGEPPSSLYGPPSPPASYLPAHHSSDLSAARHSSGYQAIGGGWQESEGANLDSSLLHKIEEILLDEENKVASSNGKFWAKKRHSIKLLGNLFCLVLRGA